MEQIPIIGSVEVDLHKLWMLVSGNGGLQSVIYEEKVHCLHFPICISTATFSRCHRPHPAMFHPRRYHTSPSYNCDRQNGHPIADALFSNLCRGHVMPLPSHVILILRFRQWGPIADELHIPAAARKREERLQAYYYKYLLSFDLLQVEERQALAEKAAKLREEETRTDAKNETDGDLGAAATTDNTEKDGFGFENGRTHTLSSFAKFADEFKRGWFRGKVSNPKHVKPSDVEREYWRILESGDEHVSVLYGSDVDSTVHGRLVANCILWGHSATIHNAGASWTSRTR